MHFKSEFLLWTKQLRDAHQKNIDRYQRLLKTKLNEVELQYPEKRLSEERFWMAMLNRPTPSMWRNPPTALE